MTPAFGQDTRRDGAVFYVRTERSHPTSGLLPKEVSCLNTPLVRALARLISVVSMVIDDILSLDSSI